MSEQQTPERNGVEPKQRAAERDHAATEQQISEGNRALPEPGALEKAKARITQLEDGWRRTAAELDNVRKRCAKDLVWARVQERARTAAGWLPIVDNLERALEHASSDPQQIIDGVRAVHQQALSILADLGFPRRDDTGRAFSPTLHEAVARSRTRSWRSALWPRWYVPGTAPMMRSCAQRLWWWRPGAIDGPLKSRRRPAARRPTADAAQSTITGPMAE
jgi:molecular chaperone GrpE (heat shock protein)